MHRTLLKSKSAKISRSQSSVIALFLRLTERIAGRTSMPSISSFNAERETPVCLNPERSIFINCSSGESTIFFFFCYSLPFSLTWGFGIFNASIASIIDIQGLLGLTAFFRTSLEAASSESIVLNSSSSRGFTEPSMLESPSKCASEEGSGSLRPVSFS